MVRPVNPYIVTQTTHETAPWDVIDVRLATPVQRCFFTRESAQGRADDWNRRFQEEWARQNPTLAEES